ncbi:cell division protein FtsQ/DivIB [Guyparkeria hydrothermalis]|uniref:cell division protein FtsQ/DivIB n=1 Tax=Guyparkeria hydrothermalis TaxID=923 RepID=UPI002021410C|nr:cell division protein FtsQ/DivIB [Guyparkeria hydrothermalis]MCL7744508.1 cell division protein FtsQ/DivIB [Guyparkeria hydrothermalis]
MAARRASQARPRGPTWRERWSAFVAGLRIAARWAWRIGLWAGFIAALALVSQRVWLKLQAPVSSIEIDGANRFVTAEAVRTELEPAKGQSIWSVDIEELRHRLLANGWLTEVRIERQWPDRLVVRLATHRPIAAWNEKRLLSAAGRVFEPQDRPADLELPELAGPSGSQWSVWERYTSLRPVLADVGLTLSGVSMSARGSLSLSLASGAVIHAGRESLETRLQRLLDVYPATLAGRMEQIERIDLRYSNGFAVAWRESATDKTKKEKD